MRRGDENCGTLGSGESLWACDELTDNEGLLWEYEVPTVWWLFCELDGKARSEFDCGPTAAAQEVAGVPLWSSCPPDLAAWSEPSAVQQ